MLKVLCMEAFGYGFIAIIIIQFLRKIYLRIRARADTLLEDMKRQEEQILWEKVLQLQKTANATNEANRKRRTSAAEIFEMYSSDKKVLQHPSANIHLGLDDEDILELLSLLSNNDDKKSNPKSVSEITKKFEVNDTKPKTHVAPEPKWQKKAGDHLFVGSKVTKAAPQKSFTRKENIISTRCEDDSKVNKAPRYKRVAPIIKPPTPVITNGLQNGNVNGNYDNDHDMYGIEATKTKELNNNYNNYQNESNFNENNLLINKKDRSVSPSESSEISEIIKGWRDTSPVHIISDTPSPVESTPSDINESTLNGNTSNSDDDDQLSVDIRSSSTEAVKSFDEILSQERFSRRLSDYSISDLIEGSSIDPNIDDIIDEIIK